MRKSVSHSSDKNQDCREETACSSESSFSRLKKFAKSKLWMLKAMAVSQISAWVDFGMSFMSFALFHFASTYSAALGAVCGGIVNCGLNYKWTFHATGIPIFNVAVKYVMVWFGSLMLNSFGTGFVTYLLCSWSVMDMFGISVNLRFTIARLLTSLIVSVFWNLLLQSRFVYRNVRFDTYLSKLRLHRS